jgi:hypothetical protein
MQKFINFGSIGQFREIIKNVQHVAQYKGQDAEGNPIYNHNALMPKIVVTGTEKIHGTNAAVCYNNIDGLWVQSRNNIITIENDNAGCAFAVNRNKDGWFDVISRLVKIYNIDVDMYTVSVFYEWCGGNIQAKSALTGIEKTSIIFQHFKVSPIDTFNEELSVWYDTMGIQPDNLDFKIYNISNFPTYEIEIDFNNPLLSQNEMIKLVEEVIEPASPVGKAFGQESNVGEGIVFVFLLNGTLQRFKVKGEKHSNSKVKTLKPVDNEKEQIKIDFANYAANPLRLEQAWQNTFGINNEKLEPSIKSLGNFLKAVMNDVVKEEMDILAEKNLEPKDVSSLINNVARRWFNDELVKNIQ